MFELNARPTRPAFVGLITDSDKFDRYPDPNAGKSADLLAREEIAWYEQKRVQGGIKRRAKVA
jgi:hypothetical protein